MQRTTLMNDDAAALLVDKMGISDELIGDLPMSQVRDLLGSVELSPAEKARLIGYRLRCLGETINLAADVLTEAAGKREGVAGHD